MALAFNLSGINNVELESSRQQTMKSIHFDLILILIIQTDNHKAYFHEQDVDNAVLLSSSSSSTRYNLSNNVKL